MSFVYPIPRISKPRVRGSNPLGRANSRAYTQRLSHSCHTEKRKAQQEEHEKIKEYGESINEERRNKK